ncbi:MAG: glycosyltransferase [Pseudomonadales bacterium]|jgi:glycosyltransferase involved in cell wall biosynthesis|nr:glycosyltransferase [Pseudomonadales bacterium]
MLHLVNPFNTRTAGSENRCIGIARLLRGAVPLRIWAAGFRNCANTGLPALTRPLRPDLGLRPRRGVLAFCGTYFPIESWVGHGRFERVVLVHNMNHADYLHARLKELEALGLRDRTVVAHAAAWCRDASGVDGPVLPSPVDTERFCPAPAPRVDRPFTVGRLSRDTASKHHPEDAALYRKLAAAGVRVRIMGGTSLGLEPDPDGSIEILPAGAEPPEAFLRSLDCFFYRTDVSRWVEPHGRVVTEAMATGLPVVCGAVGGHTEYVVDGEAGVLVEDSAGALAALLALRDDPERRRRLGAAGRAVIEARFGHESCRALHLELFRPGAA